MVVGEVEVHTTGVLLSDVPFSNLMFFCSH